MDLNSINCGGYRVEKSAVVFSLTDTTVEEVNAIMKAASEKPENQGILGYNDELLVSIDFNHDSHSSIFDSTLTKVSGTRLVKVTAWYDNEWGFSCRMLDTACAMMAAK